MRMLVVGVVTVALLVAAVPFALTQAPRWNSPLLAGATFAVAASALLAGIGLLVRAAILRRRGLASAGAPSRRTADDDPATEPRRRPAPVTLVVVPSRAPQPAGVDQSGHDERCGQPSPAGPSQIHAQQSPAGSDAVVTLSSGRSAAFAARYTATRSLR